MIEIISIAGAVATILALLWMVLFGGRTVPELMGKRKESRDSAGALPPRGARLAELRRATARDLALLVLRGVGPYDLSRFRFALSDIFVPLSAAVEPHHARAAVEESPYTGLLTRSTEARVPILGPLARERRVLVVGAAGSGKTTLLRYLALVLSSDDPVPESFNLQAKEKWSRVVDRLLGRSVPSSANLG